MATYIMQIQDHQGNIFNPKTVSGAVSHDGKVLEAILNSLQGEIITVSLSSWTECTTDARYVKKSTIQTANSYISGIKGYANYYEGGLMPDLYRGECNKIGCIDYNDSNNQLILYATEALELEVKIRI